jgi:hypothetical protein
MARRDPKYSQRIVHGNLRAYVSLDKFIALGLYGTPESYLKYQNELAKWKARGRPRFRKRSNFSSTVEFRNLPGIAKIPFLPWSPAVYFMVSRGELVYIGKTVLGWKRIRDPRHPAKSFDIDEIYVLAVDPKESDLIESLFIFCKQPRANRRQQHSILRADHSIRSELILRFGLTEEFDRRSVENSKCNRRAAESPRTRTILRASIGS